MSSYAEEQLRHWRRLARIFASVALVIGAAALLGWIINNDFLKRIHPSLVAMKANTAICLLLCSLSLLLLLDKSASLPARRVAQLLAAIVVIVGLATLSENLFGWNLGIDQVFFQESLAAAGQSFPGRIGVAGSLNLILLGMSLLFLDAEPKSRRLSTSLILAAIFVTLLVSLYYFYGIELEPIAPYFTIALHTVVAFLSLSFGLLLARPDRGVLTLFLGNSAGSILARRIWPALLAIVLLGWLRNAGHDAGLYGSGFGTAIFVLSILLIFACLIWWTAVTLNRTDAERSQAETALRRSETQLTALLDQLPVGVGLMDREGQLLLRNALFAKFVGQSTSSRDPALPSQWRAWDSDGHLLEPSEWPSSKALQGEPITRGLEMLHTNALGEDIWTRVASVPFLDQSGEVAGAIATVQDIDEQKRAGEAKWRLAAIVESSEDAIISKDLEGVITSWNTGAQRLFGYEAEEVIGKSVTILIPPERLHEEPEILKRIRRGDRIEHYETIRRRKDGALLDISLTVSPITDAQNRIIGVSKIARDVTARKQAEGRLELLAEVSELIGEIHDPTELSYAVATALGIHLKVKRCLFNETDLDLDREIVHRDYCDGVESVAGVHTISEYSTITSAEMRAGNTVVNYDSKTDPRTATDYQRSYEPTGERAYMAVPLMREDRWVASLWASDDRPRQWTREEVALFETVAERTWTAVEKLRVDKALRESEERLRLANEAAEMRAWEFDLNLDANQRSADAERVLGFSISDDLSEDRYEAYCILSKALEENTEFEMEYRVVNPTTNKEEWVLTVGRIVDGSTNTPTRVVGVTQNITRRKLAETERERLLQSEQEARDAAEKANQTKDEFLATLSHELRNPLNIILGYSELLLRMKEVQTSNQLRQMSEALRRNAVSQSHLINDLLDLSRLQTGKVSLNKEAVSLATIAENAIETVRAEAASKNISISNEAADQLLLVDGDRLRLQQIVWNLVNNAVKFTPEGGRVEIEVSKEGETAILKVTDTGEGIDSKFLPHVFEMFRQADSSNSRRHGGMGIGLALVRQLVQLHGGTVSVHSEGPGKGSEFTVRLPTARETQTATVFTRSADIHSLAQTNFLILDDSEDSVSMLAQLLTIEGANVTTATSGRDALRLAAEKDFDVILSDISMPEMDGFEFLRRLRQIAGREEVPVVAITGFGRSVDIERAEAAGFFSHLTKPLDFSGLSEVLNRLGQEINKKQAVGGMKN
jgi:PAS domain S-box-containing protein